MSANRGRLVAIALLMASLVSGIGMGMPPMTVFQGPIQTQGKALVMAGDGARFMVRGVALTANDPGRDLLANGSHEFFATTILPRLHDLNINSLRVFSVDLGQDHDLTMNLLKAEGIYVEIGFASPKVYVNRVDPQYTLALRDRVITVIDAFAGYANILGFSVGNEVVFPGSILDYLRSPANPAPCISDRACVEQAVLLEQRGAAVEKALIRDAKAYLRAKGLSIPVGLALVDSPTASLAPAGLIGSDILARFYACGDSRDRADYIGINAYRYEPGGSLDAYDDLARAVAALPIPVFLTESGAIGDSARPQTRDWRIVGEIYRRPLLSNHLSGEVAFEFFNQPNNYGLYYEDDELRPTAWGGALALGEQFAKARTQRVPLPSPVPGSLACPADFNPMLPPPPEIISVHVTSVAGVPLVVVQSASSLATLPPGSPTTPTVTVVRIDQRQALFILDPRQNFSLVCRVPAGVLANDWHVANTVVWGNPCQIDPGTPKGKAK